MTDLQWTGERVVPGEMEPEMGAFSEHLQRYVFAISMLGGREQVLDAACGTGYGTFMLAMAAGSVTGFDLCADAVEFARERFNWPGLSYEVADLDSVELPTGTDVVVSFETLEHLQDPERFLDGVARCLRPGGRLIASVPRDMPNEFHRHTYDWAGARALIEPHFDSVDWLGQTALRLGDSRLAGLVLSDGDIEMADYFLAVGHKRRL